ncbi:MAG: leucine-rich repeat domain-containing protein, partial [Candidatus Omnitrophica bacterium]|nr:leucine-rich repeat domain-containing protein [Candidatus Omnitrophota bacterium]
MSKKHLYLGFFLFSILNGFVFAVGAALTNVWAELVTTTPEDTVPDAEKGTGVMVLYFVIMVGLWVGSRVMAMVVLKWNFPFAYSRAEHDSRTSNRWDSFSHGVWLGLLDLFAVLLAFILWATLCEAFGIRSKFTIQSLRTILVLVVTSYITAHLLLRALSRPPSMSRGEILRTIKEAARKGATGLDLSGRGIKSLPSAIGRLTNLEWLDLSDNQLKSLPSSLGRIANLRELDIQDNHLRSLPKGIGDLRNLIALDACNNRLGFLPSSIERLTKLKYLHLGDNHLKELPSTICRLTSLRELSLYDNQIASLPAEIGGLTQLEVLSLDKNRIASLPPEVGRLISLNWLSLCCNQLTSLPAEIGRLIHLQKLYLLENRLVTLPAEIGNL